MIKNGDLWQAFANMVAVRGPQTVAISKVKGHATDEMVRSGDVRHFDKLGNDRADEAADLGATVSQARVDRFGHMYCNIKGCVSQTLSPMHDFMIS